VKILFSIPVIMRAVVLLFVVGFALGVSLGHQLRGVDADVTLVPTNSEISSLSLVPRDVEEVERSCTPTPLSLLSRSTCSS
jgi:hypothetical protein